MSGIDNNSLIRESLASQMRVELVVNENSEVWVLHDKPFSDVLHWAEYSSYESKLSFVSYEGTVQELGMEIPKDVGELLGKADQIFAVHMENENIKDIGILPVTAN